MQQHLKLDSYIRNNGWNRGATKATPRNRDCLKEALAEVDGLFAGFSYLDSAETEGNSNRNRTANRSPRPGYSPKQDGASAAAQDDLFLELNGLLGDETPGSQNHTLPPGAPPDELPCSQQWAALETVYDACSVYFRLFQEVAAKSDCAVIQNLAKNFQNAKALRDKAGSVFRKILKRSSAPDTLDAVFAFVSLSYIVSKLLVKKNRFRKEDLLSGLHVWRGSLPTQDRDAFDHLAWELWPDAKAHLHSFDVPVPTAEADLRPVNEILLAINGKQVSKPGSQPSMQTMSSAPATSQAPASITVSGLGIDPEAPPGPQRDEMDLFYPDPLLDPFQVPLIDIFQQTSTSDFSFASFRDLLPVQDFEATDNPPPESRVPSKGMTLSEFFFPPDLGQEYTNRRESFFFENSNDACEFQSTGVFQAVLHFCVNLYGLCWALSGQGTTTTDMDSARDRYDHEEFVETIERTFFEPLRGSLPMGCSPVFLGILVMAEFFVRYDQLRDETRVREYCVNAGKVSLHFDRITPT